MTINETIAAYIAAKTEKAAAEKRESALKKQLLSFIGTAEVFETDLYTVIIETTESTRLDTKALYADFPDIKDSYGKTSVSRSVTAVEKQATGKKSA